MMQTQCLASSFGGLIEFCLELTLTHRLAVGTVGRPHFLPCLVFPGPYTAHASLLVRTTKARYFCSTFSPGSCNSNGDDDSVASTIK